MVKDISKRQEISDLYLEQLFGRLKIAGLVRSIRGPKGGFVLTRSPSHIRLGEILHAMEGSTAPVSCVDDTISCTRSEFCTARSVWIEMKRVMDELLESTTLQDLITRETGNKVEET